MRQVTFIIVLCGIVMAQQPRSGRQYYEELRNVSGLNPLLTTVCFPDDQPDVFLLIGFTKHFSETAKSKGIQLKPDETKRFAGRDLLYAEAYVKGVPAQTLLLKRDKTAPNTWSDQYEIKGTTISDELTISPAGRFRRHVYDAKDPTTSSEHYGKCELVR